MNEEFMFDSIPWFHLGMIFDRLLINPQKFLLNKRLYLPTLEYTIGEATETCNSLFAGFLPSIVVSIVSQPMWKNDQLLCERKVPWKVYLKEY